MKDRVKPSRTVISMLCDRASWEATLRSSPGLAFDNRDLNPPHIITARPYGSCPRSAAHRLEKVQFTAFAPSLGVSAAACFVKVTKSGLLSITAHRVKGVDLSRCNGTLQSLSFPFSGSRKAGASKATVRFACFGLWLDISATSRVSTQRPLVYPPIVIH
jgi:hypothetical protein